MPNYKMQKKGKSARKVEVRAEHIEVQVPALIICAVLAFFIWLYIVGISRIPDDPAIGGDSQPSVTDTGSETEPITDGCTPAVGRVSAA